MPKNAAVKSGYVKTQTLIFAVFVAFFIGVFSGIVLSILKTGSGAVPAGIAQEDRKDLKAAEDRAVQILALEKETSRNPGNADAWARLGHLYFDSDQYQNAIDAYTKSLKIKPNSADLWTDLGVMYRRNGNPEEAVRSFDRAVEIDPRHEIARFNKGIVLVHDLHDNAGAIRIWKELLEINPLAKAPNGQTVEELIKAFSNRPAG